MIPSENTENDSNTATGRKCAELYFTTMLMKKEKNYLVTAYICEN